MHICPKANSVFCTSIRNRAVSIAARYWSVYCGWPGCPRRPIRRISIFFCLREYSPSVRIEVIDYALRQQKGYGLVIIDGIRDLMLDINNAGESVEVINRMMEWSSRYDLHIHCVLHLNKGDNNVRGHIGTEMSNKAGDRAGHQQE